MSIYQGQHYRKAMGMSLDKPPSTTIIKITAEKVEYRDLGLMRRGFAPKQVWEPSRSSP